MITQESDLYLDPRGVIEFDEYERNAYVARLLEICNADLDDAQMCSRVYEVHLELRTRHCLYIAVADRLEPKHKRALHTYARCNGDLSQLAKIEIQQ